jgi:hypothetical protein
MLWRSDVLWRRHLVLVCASVESMRKTLPVLAEVLRWARGIFRTTKVPRRSLVENSELNPNRRRDTNNAKYTV